MFELKKIKWIAMSMAIGVIGCEKPAAEKEESKPSLDISMMDTTMQASNDFYRYANGTWLKDAVIPADRSSWGSFHELLEYNETVLSFVLAQTTKGEIYDQNSNEIKAANFYASGMDSLKIESLGITPLKPLLDQIAGIQTKSEIQGVLADMHVRSAMAFFNEYVSIDEKQTDTYIMGLSQSGLGLPDRDYYFNSDDRGQEIIAGYKTMIAKLFTLSGTDSAVAVQKAEAIFNLESKLAENSKTRLERRDPESNYNKMTIDELQAMSTWIDWMVFFKAIEAKGVDQVDVGQVEFIKGLNEVVANSDLETIKDYMALKVISSNRGYLSNAYVMAGFEFYNTMLSGQNEMRPRDKRMVNATNRNLGDALSKLYVNEVFPPEAKQKCMMMVNMIKEALHERIENLGWMSAATKEQAHLKLEKLKVKIGYPDSWKDYSKIEIKKDAYLQNHLNASAFANLENFARLGQPIDMDEWHMSASTVNAYYNPPANEIVFPAGILQPPFYNYKADAAVNFGGIGAVIGHEITHGFDDSGRKYNHNGELKDWWTEEDGAEFDKRAEVMVEQYNGFAVQDTLTVNGELTLGENIADLGGMLIAYDALQMYYKKNGRPELIDGLTGEQRFFMSQATIWRGKMRPELEQQLLIRDTHSPGEYRVNGTAANMKEFYEAFNLKEGDDLWRPENDRVDIW